MQKSYRRELRELRKIIGRNIHDARCRRKMTLKKLSKRTGYTPALLDAFELGKDEIRIEHILCIAHGLDIRAGRLLSTHHPS